MIEQVEKHYLPIIQNLFYYPQKPKMPKLQWDKILHSQYMIELGVCIFIHKERLNLK